MLMHSVLSLLIWLPVVGMIPVLCYSAPEKANTARWIALSVALLSLVLCGVMIAHFDVNAGNMQFVEWAPWIPVINVQYHLGVDGISMPLVVLTCFTTLIIVLASWTMVHDKVAQYLAAFLLTQGMVVGVFCALDAVLFYVFWEAMLIPMYLSIGVWGGSNRSYAAIKFFMYTFFGSALMLVALLYMRMHTGTFNILSWYDAPLSLWQQQWLFVAFFFGFAIKVPMWPLHTWLPDAHTEAPTGGSVVLAALMLKLGGYGFLRFSLPIVPDGCAWFAWPMIVLSLIAIVYVGLIAIAQTDMKKLIAYSSVAHMGFVTLGAFLVFVILQRTNNVADAYMALEGAMTQMISHAFGSGAMFLAFGVLYQQMRTRHMADFGGVAKTMPYLAAFFMLFAMSNVGLPGTSGFVGEFMVILSAFRASFWVALLASLTLIVGAAYTLNMYLRVFYGEIGSSAVAQLTDVSGVNTVIFVLLAAAVLWIGLYPNPLLTAFHGSIGHLLKSSIVSKLV